MVGDDILNGGAGDDDLDGSNGADVYIYGIGYGHDSVVDWGDPSEVDAIEFVGGILPSNIIIERPAEAPGDVRLVLDSNDSLTITNQFLYSWSEIEEFRFSDGTIWTASDIREKYLEQQKTSNDDVIDGFFGADNIEGSAGNDVLSGFEGSDLLAGQAGDDTLVGGDGDDTFAFGSGFGEDVVIDFTAGASSDDVIEFRDGLFSDYASVIAASQQIGSDVKITLDVSNSILLTNVAIANLHEDDFWFV
jgi:Ca2+-binding RTX toxin-like protein